MMKRKNILATAMAITLAGSMLLGGCSGKSESGGNTAGTTVQETTSKADSTPESAAQTDPSQENDAWTEVSKDNTLRIMIGQSNPIFPELTNVITAEGWYPGKIEWMFQSSRDQFQLHMNTGDYGDLIFCNMLDLRESMLSQYAASGIIIPLEDYITEDIMPNLYKMFTEQPSAKAVSTFPDGHIYTLPRFVGSTGDFLEDVMYINKAWLDKLDLEVPTTIDELYDVLVAFRDGDPNGNGEADEIPMSFGVGTSGYSFVEELMGIWGLPTKHFATDGFRSVVNGEVVFVPATENWKEFLKYIRKLYQEGLINQDVFSPADDSQFLALCESDPSIVGVGWNSAKVFANPDDYIAMLPPKAPGYEVKWRLHPGAIGTKNTVCITDACKDVEGAMRWLDNFYTVENTIEQWYGPVGQTFEIVDGMYRLIDQDRLAWPTTPEDGIMTLGLPGYLPSSAFDTILETPNFMKEKMEAYRMYEPILADAGSIWPRPYTSDEQSEEINEIYTDLSAYVIQQKVYFITDSSADIDAEWDNYLKTLSDLRVDEFVSISQDAYESYNETYSSMVN